MRKNVRQDISYKTINMNLMYDTLVLSGGGCKGMIQVGALHYIYYQKNIDIFNIEKFYGTSIGAVICLLVACNIEPSYIHEFFSENCCVDFTLNSLKQGLISLDDFLIYVKKLVKENIGYIPTLLEMKTKYNKSLTFTTYCLEDKECVYITSDNFPHITCIDAVKMSCAIPYLFEEVSINNKTYIDGGIVDNFPLEIAKSSANKILGILVEDDFFYEKTFTSFTINIFTIPITFSNKRALLFAKKSGINVIKVSWKNKLEKLLKPDKRELDVMFLLGQIEAELQLNSMCVI